MERPSLLEIIRDLRADIVSHIDGLVVVLRRGPLGAISSALGGALHSLYGYVDNAIRLKFFPNSEDEETLLKWANLFVVPRNEATQTTASLRITFTGPAIIPQGTPVVASTGETYNLSSAINATEAGTQDASFTSVNTGAQTLLSEQDNISFQSSIANVDDNLELVQILSEGSDQESLIDWDDRIRTRLGNRPRGGTLADYYQHLSAISGIEKAWVILHKTNDDSVDIFLKNAMPIGSEKMQEVKETLSRLSPVDATIIVSEAQSALVNLELNISPNTAEVQSQVRTALETFLVNSAEVRGSLNINNEEQDGFIFINDLREVLLGINSLDNFRLVFPINDLRNSVEGSVFRLGTLSFGDL